MGKSVWARESRDRNIWIFAGIAALAFLLTVASYETGFFRLEPIHSDGNGYYMYLPAVFVYHDPGMHFVEHLPEDISGFSGTFFPLETGQVVDKYTMGVAVLQIPFFLVAHLLTCLFSPGQADGFSALYQWGNVASGCFYYFLGSVCVYRLAGKYSDKKSALWSVLLITFGTGLFHYITMDGSYSHVYSYALIAAFLVLVERHEETGSTGLKILGGICFGLLTLIRVTNVIVIFLYLLYKVSSWKQLAERLKMVFSPANILPIICGFVPVWLPQLIYWKWAAGSFFVNSYDLPGNVWEEHFNWLTPKIIHVLFLPNRGLFFWCPVVVLTVLGFWLCRKKKKEGAGQFFAGTVVTFLLFVYITAAWWAYDGFCGFTNRFFVDLSPVYILGMSMFFHILREEGTRRQKVLTVVFVAASLLWINLFMIEYWNNSTTMFSVTLESLEKVFQWYGDQFAKLW